MLFGGDAHLGLAIVRHSLAQIREHFVGAASGGADEIDEAEFLLICAIAFRQRAHRLFIRVVSARLFLRRPSWFAIADARMRGERLEPVARLEDRKSVV